MSAAAGPALKTEHDDVIDVSPRERDLEALRNAARHIGAKSMRDGTWFMRLVKSHAKSHQSKLAAGHWDRVYPGLDPEARARKLIDRVSLHASAAGILASIGASTGEILALVTEGLAAPIGLPAMMVAMLLEGAYTAMLQVDLACDLASIYGMPFDADDAGELATLFAIALDVDIEPKKKHDDEEDEEAPKGMVARLMALEEGEVATRIGRKLIEDAVVRNIIPFAGIPISARWNYVGTQKLGTAVRKYVRYRRAIARAVRKLHFESVSDAAILVEGAWLLSTVDGTASHEEMLGIALIVDSLPENRRCAIEHTVNDDEEAWFAQLPDVPEASRDQLLDALYFVASTDKQLQPAERRFLRRVGKALHRDVDLDRVEQICKHLARGEDLPETVRPSIP